MFLCSKNVSYLGFRLTEEGIIPGKDKLKAVARAEPPESVQEIRQFLGISSFLYPCEKFLPSCISVDMYDKEGMLMEERTPTR
jgi:hypothetical protein